MNWSDTDRIHMKRALRLARMGLGFTEPNPMVGAVWVKEGRVLATGVHRRAGAPHAEREALEKVNEKGGTLYVTLEPCVHHGRTPPCVDLVLKKKIQRVVVADGDPDPRVNGRGFDRLRNAGVQVDCGCLSEIHRRLNRHYFSYHSNGRPWVTIKAGVSLDGKLTDKDGGARWVTSHSLRRLGHSLRGEFSAVMVGAGTARADDPGLDMRHEAWAGKTHTRVVLDTHNCLDPGLRLFTDQERFPTLIFNTSDSAHRYPHGVETKSVPPGPGGVDLESVLDHLGRMGILSVLVEGGGALINSFLSLGIWDEMVLFCADTLLGGRDAVTLFSSGVPVSHPVRLRERRVFQLDDGFIVRGVA